MKDYSQHPSILRSPFWRIVTGIIILLAIEGPIAFGQQNSEQRAKFRESTWKEVEEFRSDALKESKTAFGLEIPEASEPCEPKICEWWDRLRKTGNELRARNRDLKDTRKLSREFLRILSEGLENKYRIPVDDLPPLILFTSLEYHRQRLAIYDRGFDTGRIRTFSWKNGMVGVLVKIDINGKVGNVAVLKGLRSDMDTLCLRARGQDLFLPAVRDNAFVPYTVHNYCVAWSVYGLD
jgi:hypothetical protein